MVAILQQGGVLIAAVPSSATDEDLRKLLDNLSTRVAEAGARGVVVDVSALDVLDSFATRMLQTVAEVVHLRGARAVIVGIRPDVALAMVELGATLEQVETALNLEEGIRLIGTQGDRNGRGGH